MYSNQSFRKKQRKNDSKDEYIHTLFNKKFHFEFNNEWILPDKSIWFSSIPWYNKKLQNMKNKLNDDKSKLNDFIIEEWSNHTRRRNPAGDISWRLRSSIAPEFLTQAWTKFYECAYTYDIVPNEATLNRHMVSLHLCEAPGAFIASLNHYLKSYHDNINWKWLASTLNPYYEGNSTSSMINDDRFIFHTLENWEFGVDNTGNLMDWANSEAIIKRAKSIGKVLLVTADGSIDCLQRPEAQEEVTSPLHYCEIVTALQALSPGGTFIFKLFTMLEHSTVNLLYLLNHLFEQINIFKPVTSRQGNSEVYAICLRFNDSDVLKQCIPILKTAYGTDVYSNKSLFPEDAIPEDFMKQIEDCAEHFCSMQSQVINNNLYTYNNTSYMNMKMLRINVANIFMYNYKLTPLRVEQEILKGILQNENKINTNPRYHRGSYTEREMYAKMSLKEKHHNIFNFLQADVLPNSEIFLNEPVNWIRMYGAIEDLNIVFTYGRPLDRVNSSKFIFVTIFKLYQQILAEHEFKEIIFSKSTQNNYNKTFDFNDSKVLRLPDIDFLDNNYNKHEKNSFVLLLNKLKTIKLGDNLLICNLNLLTHFNVSILYILASKCFEKIGFTLDGIILDNMLDNNVSDTLQMIENECRNLESDETKAVLNTLSVQMINSGEFFNNIVFYNNTIYKNKCLQYLTTIEETI